MRAGGRRILIIAGLALAGISPAASAAAPPPREGIPGSLTERAASQRFLVHYSSSDPAHAVDPGSVPGILGIAERAYDAEVSGRSGFGPPLDDGDGRVDIYVFDLEEDVALTRGDRPTRERPNQASAYIELDRSAAGQQGYGQSLHYILPHEIFHVLQFAYSGREALWMAEATAEWAVRSLVGVDFYARPEENWFLNPNQPLDCFEDSCGGTPTEERATQGYDRWPFFRYLEERFGPRIVYEIWVQSRALSVDGEPHALEAIEAALRARGSSLSRMFGDFVVSAGAGAWEHETLRRWLPTPVATLRTGRAASLQSLRLQVAHLAASYVALAGGGGPQTLSICLPSRLRLEVLQGGGQAEGPALVWAGGGPTPLLDSGSYRSLEVPWQTCQSSAGTLAFPNTTWNVDGVSFDLTAGLTRPRALRLTRSGPYVTFYLELPAPRKVRAELGVPASRERDARTVIRRRSVRAGVRPLRIRLPRNAPRGRYRLTVKFRDALGQPLVRSRSFAVRFR